MQLSEPIKPKKKKDVLFLTMAIGEQYKKHYIDLFFDSHRAYCEKYGYDLFVIDDFVDSSDRDDSLITYQKYGFFFCELVQNYKWVLFVDADVLINVAAAPPALAMNTEQQVACFVNEFSQPSSAERLHLQKVMGWEQSGTEYYQLAGFDWSTDQVLNGGVMLLNVAHHAAVMRQVFVTGKTHGRNHPRGPHFEQALIGYALARSGPIKIVDNRWNAIYGLYATIRGVTANSRSLFFRAFFRDNYFTHFAGKAHLGLERDIADINATLRR